jgi:predicted metal-dependent peptidase
MLAEDTLKKSHRALMRHPETCLYSGVMMMGESSVDDTEFTACTDGVNKHYSRGFLDKLRHEEVNALVLHENLHVLLKHIPRFRSLMQADPRLTNMAMDFVVNDVIMNLKDKTLCKLPEGGCYDPMFHGWDVTAVYNYLKEHAEKPDESEGNKPNDGEGSDGNGSPSPSSNSPRGRGKLTVNGKQYEQMDEHDAGKELTEDEVKQLSKDIDEALHQGIMLAGRFGSSAPRAITDMLEVKTDWKQALAQFVTSSARGNSEYTWRKFNRRRLADDIFRPTVEDETVSEIVVPIDTSGSIGGEILNKFASELASICEACQPDRVRVLWWDTKIHGEQVFTDNYDQLRHLLKPKGGGGTDPQCISDYLNDKKINADCMVVLTDGYFASTPKWNVTIPTLWAVTMNNRFTAPSGVVINID